MDPEKTVRALVVAGGIGSSIALSASISGAAGGCQKSVAGGAAQPLSEASGPLVM